MEDFNLDVDPIERCRRAHEAGTGDGEHCPSPEATFRLEFSVTGGTGKPRLDYRVWDSRLGEDPLFESFGVCASPCDAVAWVGTLGTMLTLWSLRPGGVDAEALALLEHLHAEWIERYAETSAPERKETPR